MSQSRKEENFRVRYISGGCGDGGEQELHVECKIGDPIVVVDSRDATNVEALRCRIGSDMSPYLL
jgi:hypothetical protein